MRLLTMIPVGVHTAEKAQRAHMKFIKRRSHSFFVTTCKTITEACETLGSIRLIGGV